MADRMPAILLMGATATGKTALAMALADSLPVRLISVDSVLVYRGLDIGSAKPDPKTLAAYPHDLIDVCDPAYPFSVADFCEAARSSIQRARQEGRVPVLVGGTSMYFKALCHGLGDMPSADPAIRARLEEEAASLGWPALHARLSESDPLAAARIHPHNRQRIQRALEVLELSGKPLSSFWSAGAEGSRQWDNRPDAPGFRALSFAIEPGDRDILYQRINQRFDEMLAEGFIDEVRGLYGRPDLSLDLPSMRAVGYRQVWEYLAGDVTYESMVERGKAATRQLAKRQWTWMRSWEGLRWLQGDPQKNLQGWVRVIREALNSADQGPFTG